MPMSTVEKRILVKRLTNNEQEPAENENYQISGRKLGPQFVSLFPLFMSSCSSVCFSISPSPTPKANSGWKEVCCLSWLSRVLIFCTPDSIVACGSYQTPAHCVFK